MFPRAAPDRAAETASKVCGLKEGELAALALQRLHPGWVTHRMFTDNCVIEIRCQPMSNNVKHCTVVRISQPIDTTADRKSISFHEPSNMGSFELCHSSTSFRDNPFFSGIDAMPDIRPRKKSIPLVSELVGDRHHKLVEIVWHFFSILRILRSIGPKGMQIVVKLK